MSAAENQIAIQTPDRLIALAIERDADVDKLAKLMDLQERWQAQQARTAFFDALARFQSDAPPVPKSKEVKNRDGSTRYKYAPLDAVIATLREPLLKHGFSYRFETVAEPDALVVTCIAHHVAGHSESASVRIPGIVGQGTNAAQDQGSANTYGRRYAFLDVFGVTSANEDDDGESAGPKHTERLIRMAEIARDNFSAIVAIKEGFAEHGDWTAAAEAYAELSRDEIAALFIAPSKGGLFTTAERKRAHDDKEFQAEVHRRRQDSGWYEQEENKL